MRASNDAPRQDDSPAAPASGGLRSWAQKRQEIAPGPSTSYKNLVSEREAAQREQEKVLAQQEKQRWKEEKAAARAEQAAASTESGASAPRPVPKKTLWSASGSKSAASPSSPGVQKKTLWSSKGNTPSVPSVKVVAPKVEKPEKVKVEKPEKVKAAV